MAREVRRNRRDGRKPEVATPNPAPAGPEGGAYRPLTDAEVLLAAREPRHDLRLGGRRTHPGTGGWTMAA